MVIFGPEGGRGIHRLMIAILFGWLVSWLGVAALVTLSVTWPHNPIPRVLLVVWAVLAAVSFAIPGGSLKAIRGWGPVLVRGWGPVLALVLAVPFVPLARAALVLWPHLPKAVQDLLEGNFRRNRRARLQRKQAR